MSEKVTTPESPAGTVEVTGSLYLLAASADSDPVCEEDLLSDSEIAAYETEGLELPRVIGGQPVHYLRKDVIYPRIYEGKKKDGSPFTLSASLPRIKDWIKKDNAMLSKKIDVPVVKDHIENSDNTRGYAKKFWLGARNRMTALMQFIGDKNALLAARNRVSVAIHPNYVDDSGQPWGDVVRHIALTPIGVVSNQGDWVAMSATDQTEILLLSASNEWRPAMGDDGEMMPCSAAQVTAVDRHVPGFAAKKPAERMDHLIDHLHRTSRGMHMLSGTDPESAGDIAKLSDAVKTKFDATTAELATTKAKLAEKPQVIELSAADKEIAESRADLYRDKINLAVDKGMSPTIAAKLKAALPEGKPTMVLLSAASDLGGKRPMDFILGLFDGETPAVDREGKGKLHGQVLPLSAAGERGRTPEEMGEPQKMDLAERNTLRRHAGLPALMK